MTRYEAEDGTIVAVAREYIDAAHTGFTDMSDMVTDAQPDASETVIYEDDETFWSNVSNTTLSEELTIVKTGTSSLKCVVSGGAGHFQHDYGAGDLQDFSGKDYFGFWWYGANTSDSWTFRLKEDSGDNFYFVITDNWAGWKWISINRDDFTDSGTPDWSIIRRISFESLDDGTTFYLDHLCFYDGLWTPTANTLIEINNASAEDGTYCVRYYPSGIGYGYDSPKVTPIVPIANLLKFDSVKFKTWIGAGDEIYFSMHLVDGSNNYVYKNLNNTVTPTEYIWAIPHASDDLQTWTDVGGFDPEDFAFIRFRWNCQSGSEMFFDNVHFFIDTTTTRGRGETLSDGTAVVLDAITEYVEIDLVAGTDIEAGFYEARAIAKSTDSVTADLELDVEGVSGFYSPDTAFADDYTRVFEVTAADVGGGATITIKALKALATENTMFVDYFEVVGHEGRHEPYGFDSLQTQLFEVDDFLGAVLDDRWATEIDAGGSIAVIDGETGGVVRLTTDGDTDDDSAITWNAIRILLVANRVIIEARMKLDSASNVLGGLYLQVDGTDYLTIKANTGNGANWFIQAYATGNTDKDSGIALDTDEHIYRIECHTHGFNHVHYLIDGVECANSPINSASHIPTDPLQARIFWRTLENSAKSMDIDYVGVTQDR
jgi:hypothetical protein